MLNWIVLNRTDYFHKVDLTFNNLQKLIYHKNQPTNQPTNQLRTCQKRWMIRRGAKKGLGISVLMAWHDDDDDDDDMFISI